MTVREAKCRPSSCGCSVKLTVLFYPCVITDTLSMNSFFFWLLFFDHRFWWMQFAAVLLSKAASCVQPVVNLPDQLKKQKNLMENTALAFTPHSSGGPKNGNPLMWWLHGFSLKFCFRKVNKLFRCVLNIFYPYFLLFLALFDRPWNFTLKVPTPNHHFSCKLFSIYFLVKFF